MSFYGSTRPLTSRPVKAVLVLALVLGATAACSQSSDGSGGGRKGSGGSSSGGSSGGGSQPAKDWAVGDCAGPDAENKDSFLALDCDDPQATIKALEIKDGEMFSAAVQCPAGTDEIISVKISIGGGDASSGLPSKTVCGRNLSDDHPGDAGAGGGQLVVGDCVDDQAKEVPCAGAGEGVTKVVALTEKVEECPAEADSPLKLFPAVGRPYNAICGKAV